MTLAELAEAVGARAAGVWERQGDALVLLEFWACADMAEGVGTAFAEATRSVPLNRIDLGIVGAAVEGRPRVSIAAELPETIGSGLWLRRFGAERSIAVPRMTGGEPVAVASVAVPPGCEESRVIERIAAYLEGQETIL